MRYLQFTLFSFLSYSIVKAGSANHNDSCNLQDNKLQAGTFQFFSDCNSVTFCFAGNNTCQPKKCRRDEFPFGYNNTDEFPPKCDKGTFCPDEEDDCQPLLAVGSPCQLNRDDQCEAPPDFKELADTTHKGLNFNGSVCLNNVCMWANNTEGNSCTVENTPYIAYGPSGEFIDVVSRGDCRIGLYCDSQQLKCIKNKLLGDACDSDKECDSYNCLSTGVCGLSADTPRHFATWVYAVVGIAIIGGMVGTLVGLFFLHKKFREDEREKRLQYWREQNAFHQNLLQMRETAQESHTPILHSGVPKGSGLRYMSDEGSEYDEGYLMQPPAQAGRF